MIRSLILTLMILATAPAIAMGDIVTIAQGEIGKGEIGGDNKGKTVRKYTKGKDVAWCAGFVSWSIRQSGRGNDYIISARQYWNKYKDAKVKVPRRGDIACFYRGKKTSWQGHVGIVEKVEGDTITIIEGNKGAYPSRVARYKYNINKIPNLLGFVRIPNENSIQNRS